MISQIQYYLSQETLPEKNLALEAYLLETVPVGGCTLYLWQNQHTVVIGKHQNAWQVCKVGELEAAGGHLVRRLSGGGAVFHDLGNLNFTFLLNQSDYDLARQLKVILLALAQLGILAEQSGRNDLVVGDKKFSGNAFYHSNGRSYHHGTLLVDVDKTMLSRYLNVPAEKLQAKGIASVQSRVVNLKSICPDLTIQKLEEQLILAFGVVYGHTPQALKNVDFDQERLNTLEAKFSAPLWRLGQHLPFDYRLSKRFAWGEIDLQLLVKQGLIAQVCPYSDAMNGELIASIGTALTGCPFATEAMAHALQCLYAPEDGSIIPDIQALIRADAL